jgi:hypothetical protein
MEHAQRMQANYQPSGFRPAHGLDGVMFHVAVLAILIFLQLASGIRGTVPPSTLVYVRIPL